jgi:hypothetical protein
MNLQLARQLNLRNPPKILFQDFRLNRELLLIPGMLIVAAPATLKITTLRLRPLRRSHQNLFQPRTRKSWLILDNRCLYGLARKNKRHKHRFPAAALAGRQTRQAVAPIDQFFNSELQIRILLSPRKSQTRRTTSAIWAVNCGFYPHRGSKVVGPLIAPSSLGVDDLGPQFGGSEALEFDVSTWNVECYATLS